MSNDYISNDELSRKFSSLEHKLENLLTSVSTIEQKVLVLDTLFRGDGNGGGLREQVRGLEHKIEDTAKLIDEKLTPLQKFMWTMIGIGGIVEIILMPIFFHFISK